MQAPAAGLSVRDAVRSRWERVLGAESFAADRSWEESGGDSLKALELVFALEEMLSRPVAMALLVYAIAIPFFLRDYTSLPLSVGVLSGLMWVPMSWLIGHWVGLFHAIARTVLVTAAWYLFPDARFVVIPFVIVAIYAVTIVVLEQRWRQR